MKENKILIILGVVVVLLLGVFWWLVFRLVEPAKPVPVAIDNSAITNPAKPYFPAGTETYLDKEKTWQRKSFQPIYKEYLNASPSSYLIVNYLETASGAIEEGKIFLGGQISYTDEVGKSTVINSTNLQSLLKMGDQFGIDYLSTVPVNYSFSMPHCADQTKRPIECSLAAFQKSNTKVREKIFYPLFIYRKLKP